MSRPISDNPPYPKCGCLTTVEAQISDSLCLCPRNAVHQLVLSQSWAIHPEGCLTSSSSTVAAPSMPSSRGYDHRWTLRSNQRTSEAQCHQEQFDFQSSIRHTALCGTEPAAQHGSYLKACNFHRRSCLSNGSFRHRLTDETGLGYGSFLSL